MYSWSVQHTQYRPSSDGWLLDVRRYAATGTGPGKGPVLMVPGYCMNTTPLIFHPEGPSMIEYMTSRGLEVWTANLRGQGESRSIGGRRNVGFAELALLDLPAAMRVVLENTKTKSERMDIVGCSLGGTYAYAYLAHHLDSHPIRSIVGLGAPLRWEKTHPVLRALFGSSRIAGRVPITGTRRLARALLPVALHVPKVLSIYMNTSNIDLSDTERLTETVEDPIPRLNGEIARWIKGKDLVLDGINVTEAFGRVELPFLCIVANKDGIVPADSTTCAMDLIGSSDRTLLVAGDDTTWFAHADLFISHPAKDVVFEPLADWLLERNS